MMLYVCTSNKAKHKKIEIMKTYISFLNKKATLASNKKEASKNLGIAAYKVVISNVDISMLKNYTIVN